MGNPIVTGTSTNNTVSVNIDLFRYPVRYIKVYLGGDLVGTFHPISDFHLRNPDHKPVKVALILRMVINMKQLFWEVKKGNKFIDKTFCREIS